MVFIVGDVALFIAGFGRQPSRRGDRVTQPAGRGQLPRAPLYQLDASLHYSSSLFLPLTFSPMSACLRSENFINQSAAIDAGGRLLRPKSNSVRCRSAASDRRRSISARASRSALDVSRCWSAWDRRCSISERAWFSALDVSRCWSARIGDAQSQRGLGSARWMSRGAGQRRIGDAQSQRGLGSAHWMSRGAGQR